MNTPTLTQAIQLTNEEKGRILETAIERAIKELPFALIRYLREKWSIRKLLLRTIIVAKDDGKGQEPKPDFVVWIFINRRLAIILRVEAHNYAIYFVAIEWTEKNTIRKFEKLKRHSILPELWVVVGHVLYTDNAYELLKANDISHIYVDHQLLSYDDEYGVQQIVDQLVEQLAPYVVMHFICRYLKPEDIKKLEKIDDLDKFNRAFRHTINRRLKEADDNGLKQLIRQAMCKQCMRASLSEGLISNSIDEYKYPYSELGGFDSSLSGLTGSISVFTAESGRESR
jgi:hypothetical protein